MLGEQKRSQKLSHELEITKKEFEQDKLRFEKQILALKKEIHRNRPLQDSSFFSLSKELKEAVELMNDIEQPNGNKAQKNVSVEQVELPPIDSDQTTEASQQTTAAKTVTKEVEPGEENKEKAGKKKKSKKKLLITGGAAIAAIAIISVGLSTRLTSSPKVDEELVQEYLNREEGEVAGATAQESGNTNSEQQITPTKLDKAKEVQS